MNCIVKKGNTYTIESYQGIENLSQQAKGKLVEDIKMMTGFKFGFVNALNEVIGMPSLVSLLQLVKDDKSIKLLIV